jgi:hypothetical protein
MLGFDVQAALWGQVKDAPHFSRPTIEACANEVQRAIVGLSDALGHARRGDAKLAADGIENTLRRLEGAPPRLS